MNSAHLEIEGVEMSAPRFYGADSPYHCFRVGDSGRIEEIPFRSLSRGDVFFLKHPQTGERRGPAQAKEPPTKNSFGAYDVPTREVDIRDI
jgi:hypothetical protein